MISMLGSGGGRGIDWGVGEGIGNRLGSLGGNRV